MNRWLAAFSGVSSWTKDRRCPLGHGTARVFAVILAISALVLTVQSPLRAQTAQPTGAGTKAQGTSAVCTIPRGPDALWQLAQCCSKSLAGNRDCREYDPKFEYIILKDNAPTKPDSYMIIPTKRITGIEDREIFAMPFVDFWEYGWQRSRQYPGKPASRTAMAINSAHARTQDQLHIHISCVRPDVSKILENQKPGDRHLSGGGGHAPATASQQHLSSGEGDPAQGHRESIRGDTGYPRSAEEYGRPEYCGSRIAKA